MTELLLDGTVVELMMPVQSRRQGDDLLVDNVDVKRAARNFLSKTRAPDWVPPKDLNQAMELMATFLGYANLLAANKQAAQAPEFFSSLVYQKLQPSSAAGFVEPQVFVYVGDARFNADAPRLALERARQVDGRRDLYLDMSSFDSITALRQFRKLAKPDVIICENVQMGANSVSTSELMHVMVNHPDIEFRLVMPTVAEAHALFATWVYQDNSPAISGFTADIKDSSGEGRVHHKTQAYDPADTRHTRALVAYPAAFHDSLRAARSVAAEQDLAAMLRTGRRDGRQMTRIDLGVEDVVARAQAMTAAGPGLALAALENAKHTIFFGPGNFVTQSATFSPAPDTFPADCGPKFDQRWKNLASAGFYSCLAGVVHSADIVAIIGRPRTGKSLLVNAMAKSMDGIIVDFRLKTWREDFDRVRREQPSLVFMEELYAHGEPTMMEVAAFTLNAKRTKTVFVFQDYNALMQSMLSRRDPSGRPLFSQARVLDLDQMTMNTVYSQEPMSYEERQRRVLMQDVGLEYVMPSETRDAVERGNEPVQAPAKGSAQGALSSEPAPLKPVRFDGFEGVLLEYVKRRGPDQQIPVIVAEEDLSAQEIMKLVIDSGALSKAFVIDCRKDMREPLRRAMRNDPDIMVFDHSEKASISDLSEAMREALNTGHHITLRVSDPFWRGPEGLDLSLRCWVTQDQASPKAPAPAAPARRKPRP